MPDLLVSANGHFLETTDGKPFFWLGDTGWLLFTKLIREEAAAYLDDRAKKGFNVVQVMVLHEIADAVNVYGDSALVNGDITNPLETKGSDFEDPAAYDFWDHVDYVIRLAEQRGIYVALVPLWGSNIKERNIQVTQAKSYGAWIAHRLGAHSNIIWLNGGDIVGADAPEIWNALGNAIRENDPRHLISFHPRGRTQSSQWFHEQPWLDFNMIQSGHRRYDQDDSPLGYGEDNWRYVQSDYQRTPPKPTIDGEPSYEGIPQGLHDTTQPYWTDADVRRYAYWSVFAGACGFTYGHNAVMQFYRAGDKPAFGARVYWQEALEAPGSRQMKWLRQLMLSHSYSNRVPEQDILLENDGTRYDYLLATGGTDYAFVYTYTGQEIQIRGGKLKGKKISASWFDPRNGTDRSIGSFPNRDTLVFQPPGRIQNGNDWVLVLDAIPD